MTSALRAWRVVVAASLLGCSSPPSAREQFAREVVPVLRRRCAAPTCHGVPPNAQSRRLFHFPTDDTAAIEGDDRVDAAYAAARRFIDTTEVAELSSLLRKPLPAEQGGLPHGGGAAFRDREDPAFIAVRAWIQRERDGGEDGHRTTLGEGERHFADSVQPLLRSAQCMLGPCHGVQTAVPLRFDPGVDGTFGVAATRANYREAQLHLNLAGWPDRSRLLRKVLGDPAELLPHRGGNGIAGFPFRVTDPLARAIVSWAALERRLRTRGAPDGVIDGFVFVGGPPRAARVVEHDEFTPGTDLYFVGTGAGQSPRSLTGALHTTPVEIRTPAVDDEGTHVAFAMRRDASGGFAIWEHTLSTGDTRQRTQSMPVAGGRMSHDLWPAYAPDGRLWFVSTRAGVLAEHGDGLDTDLYVLEPDGSITRRTDTPSPELSTSFFRYGRETSGQVAFTAIRRLGDSYQGVVYRFPNDLHVEYHLQFGATLPDDITFHMRETADGNYVAVALDRDAVWDAGALVWMDRNLGPRLTASDVSRASLPAYVSPVAFLGPYGSDSESPGIRREFSDGAYRDPTPLPDGRIATSYASGTVALRDRTQTPDFGIYTVSLVRGASGRLTIARRDRIADLPGVSETEPIPVFRNVPGVLYERPPTGATGRVAFNGVGLLQQIVGSIPAAGTRAILDGVRSVRILQWLPVAQDDALRTIDPTLHLEQRVSGATPHMRSRVLGEVPVESDGTFFAELDAGTAFRLQYLDSRGMSVGAQHNRWFDIRGGQLMRQGARPSAFDVVCAHCHGSRSGAPTDAFPPVDVTSQPSRSLARFDNDDPDRPRDAVRLSSSTVIAADWRGQVLPILQRSCTASQCHDAATHAAGLALTGAPTAAYDVAYASLVRRGDGSAGGFRYIDVVGTRARSSYLVERLLGEELDAPAALASAVAHRGTPRVNDAEIGVIIRWIESGSLYCAEHCP